VVSTYIPVEVRGECQLTQALADRLSVKTSRPSCDQDDAGFDRNPIWSAQDKRITALMPIATAEDQKAQNQVIFLENFSDELRRKVPVGQ
jgi:hypothetical protein